MKRILSIAFFLAFFMLSLSAQDFRNFRIPERIVSPETVGDTVILRLAGEYATDVRVEGSWASGQLPMQKHEGVWELKVARRRRADHRPFQPFRAAPGCGIPQHLHRGDRLSKAFRRGGAQGQRLLRLV